MGTERSVDAGPAGVTFGRLLRQLRLRAGRTQEDPTEQVRLRAPAIRDLPRGLQVAPRKETVTLLDVLALPPSERSELLGAACQSPASPMSSIAEAWLLTAPPVPPTSLVGLAAEINQLIELLRRPDVRLAMLTGTCEVGKTRVAVRTQPSNGMVPSRALSMLA